MANLEEVILVDERDHPIGFMEKIKAHELGLLHRAFSIFILNDEGEMLLQKRAKSKYHSGGLWTNACCSHPRGGETTISAAHRRLEEEMGFDTELQNAFEFIYRADLDKGLIEHEYDHVFVGNYSRPFVPNEQEVEDWKYIGLPELKAEIVHKPELFTPWFKIAFERLVTSGNE